MAKIKEAQENTQRKNHSSKHLQRKNWNIKIKEPSRNIWKRGSRKRAPSKKEPEDKDVQELAKKTGAWIRQILQTFSYITFQFCGNTNQSAALFRYLSFCQVSVLLAWWIWTKRGELKEPSSRHNVRVQWRHDLQVNILAHNNKGNHDHQIIAAKCLTWSGYRKRSNKACKTSM